MATSYAGRGTRGTNEPRAAFSLQIISPNGRMVVDVVYTSWAELAQAARGWDPVLGMTHFKALTRLGTLKACTDNGTPVNLRLLFECRPPVRFPRWDLGPFAGYVRRSTPVPYVSKLRGGPGYFRRRIHTRTEIRDNHAIIVIEDDGARLVRGARHPSNIPKDWDDLPRCRERGWKAQHRGRKAWDRARHNEEAAR